MNFGNMFRYNCTLDGKSLVWRVVANSQEEADAKVDDFIQHCREVGMDVPTSIKCISKEDNIILY